MDNPTKVSTLERVAGMARARVEDALKSTVERELVTDKFGELAPPRHSKFEHVVAERVPGTAQHQDKSLASSIWGPDSEGEERIKEFAERLATLKIS
jgi:hypothetical protein